MYFQDRSCCISHHKEQQGPRITAEALVNCGFHCTFPGSLAQLTASACEEALWVAAAAAVSDAKAEVPAGTMVQAVSWAGDDTVNPG